MPQQDQSYFSISFNLILLNQPMPYNIFINSSILENREKYVRLFAKGNILTEEDLTKFKDKYKQLYVCETERSDYLKSLCLLAGKDEKEKAIVLKDSAIGYLDNLFDQNREFSTEVFNEALEGCKDVVVGLVDVLQGYDVDKLQELIATLSFHDFYTYDHSINVSMYCILLYRLIKPNASRHEIISAGFGGLLHDLGKIKIPTQIINKPGKLTEEEFNEIKKHPDYGFEVLNFSGIQVPQDIDQMMLIKIILEHHENFDGTGYPRKISGDNISIYARVAAIADFFDAITTKRSYHDALSTSEALALMTKSINKKIDPKVFEVFTLHTKQFEKNRRTDLELERDFDPCQPSALSRWSKKPDFGQIIFMETKNKKRAKG